MTLKDVMTPGVEVIAPRRPSSRPPRKCAA